MIWKYLDPDSAVAIQTAEDFRRIYRGRQYDHLAPWHHERDSTGKYVPMRNRKPCVRYNLGRTVCKRPRDFMMGEKTFPAISSPAPSAELQQLLTWLRDAHIRGAASAACVDASVEGAAAITFSFVRGKLRLRTWRRAQAWPVFDEALDLLGLVILYLGKHRETGRIVWWRLTLDSNSELWEFSETASSNVPADSHTWQQFTKVDHNLGFVPAVWIRQLAEDDPEGVEGTSILDGIEDHIRELDYAMSRRSRALTYSADPQPVLQDENPKETGELLLKSPGNTWMLGEKGKAYYLEIQGKGIELQGEFAADVLRGALQMARIVLPDPERIRGSNMSGFALRTLYESMVDLCDNLKVDWEPRLVELVQKIVLAMKRVTMAGNSVYAGGYNLQAALRPIVVPSDVNDQVTAYHPWIQPKQREWIAPLPVEQSLQVSLHWGPYFDSSPDEESTIVQTATAALLGGIVSRRTAVRLAATHTGVQSVEEEIAMIDQEQGNVPEPEPATE